MKTLIILLFIPSLLFSQGFSDGLGTGQGFSNTLGNTNFGFRPQAGINYLLELTSIDSLSWIDTDGNNAVFKNSNCLEGVTGTNNFINTSYVYSEETELEIYGRWTDLTASKFHGAYSANKYFGFGILNSGSYRSLWGNAFYDGGTPDTLVHWFKLNKNGLYVDNVLAKSFAGHATISNSSTSFYMLNCLGINIMTDFELYYFNIKESGVLISEFFITEGKGTSVFDSKKVQNATLTSADYWSTTDNYHGNINNGFDVWQCDADSLYLYVALASDGSAVLTNGNSLGGYTWVAQYTQDGSSFLPCETELQIPYVKEIFDIDYDRFIYDSDSNSNSLTYQDIKNQISHIYSETDAYTTTDFVIREDSTSSGKYNSETFTMLSLGNSITNGVGTTPGDPYPNSYPTKLNDLLESDGHTISTFTKAGTNGATSEIMDTILLDNNYGDFDIVTLMIGIVDAAEYKDQGSSISETVSRYKFAINNIIDRINTKQTPTKIIFIIPTEADWDNLTLGGIWDASVESYYDAVKDAAVEFAESKKYDDIIIIRGDLCCDGTVAADYVDGLHLSNQGALKLANYIRDRITLLVP